MKRPINDNDGDVLGPIPFGDTFEKWRVAEVAKLVEADLLTRLDYRSKASDSVLDKGSAYHQGLTNGEIILGVLTALSRVQVSFVAKLLAMQASHALATKPPLRFMDRSDWRNWIRRGRRA